MASIEHVARGDVLRVIRRSRVLVLAQRVVDAGWQLDPLVLRRLVGRDEDPGRALGPLLGADPQLKGPKGRIVMISSVAGKSGNPTGAAYAASKHAIEGLSESLRREMMLFGIDVIIIAPGAVKTPIWDKGQEVDISVYKNSPYFPALEKVRAFTRHLSKIGLPPETIAEKIFESLTLANPSVRYQITPDPMRHLILSWLPKRTVDKMIAKRLGLTPQP